MRHNIHWSINIQSNKGNLAKNLSKGGKLILGGSAQPRVGDSVLQSGVPKPGMLCSALYPSQASAGDNKPFQEAIWHNFDQIFNVNN